MYRYGQWLKTFFVLHPTFWLKVVEGVSSIFASKSKVFNKVIYMDKLIELYNLFGADQLKIPEEVIRYTALYCNIFNDAVVLILDSHQVR